ncbi:uncharacterized protein LOC143358110 [Halictus rubicundus]|uniref:uncharacterized protein LOC143358110 n=1 Tax=Halictus rubicundus TaxID=77578 RepID=UPI0040369DBB
MKQFKKRIKSNTIFDLQERMEPIIENDSIYTFAMLLDPRFKDQLLTPNKRHETHEKFCFQISNHLPTKKNSEIKIYFNENVVSRDTNIIEWWGCHRKRFPILSLAAQHYLAVPATQVTSERLFSTSGNIVTQTRSRTCLVVKRSRFILHPPLSTTDMLHLCIIEL